VVLLQQSTGAALEWYAAAAIQNPIITKAWTSGVAYLLGDSLAQRLAGGKFAPGRMARSAIAGFVSHGPTLHFWCLLLDRFVDLGTGRWAQRGTLVVKILLDQTIFSLYLNAAYCALTETLRGTSPRVLWARVRASSWPMLRSSWRFWPAVHAFTFSVVPLHLRVLWVDVVEVVWVAILATLVAAAGKDAAHEGQEGQMGQEGQEEQEGAEGIEVVDGAVDAEARAQSAPVGVEIQVQAAASGSATSASGVPV